MGGENCRAGELRGLYRGLQLQGLAAAERLDVLLHVKFRAKEFDCSLTRELVQLIDREADLINRCVTACSHSLACCFCMKAMFVGMS